jgi:hypothetical protein
MRQFGGERSLNHWLQLYSPRSVAMNSLLPTGCVWAVNLSAREFIYSSVQMASIGGSRSLERSGICSHRLPAETHPPLNDS